MSGWSDYEENRILDFVLGNGTPATLYPALFTAAPSDAGGGTEVSGGSYARVAVTNNATNFPAATGGAKTNGADFTFPTATASWGTVTHVGLFDASSGGNLKAWAALAAPQAVASGATPVFATGDLDWVQG